MQTLWAEKIQSTTDAGSLNTFVRNEIEVAHISSALLRIACLVILYNVPDQELAADGVSGPVCGLALDYLRKMKISVMVRQLDLGHILWCGRVVREIWSVIDLAVVASSLKSTALAGLASLVIQMLRRIIMNVPATYAYVYGVQKI